MAVLSFSVHAEVKGKGRARANWRQRVVHTPQATVRYEKMVAAEAKEAMRRQGAAPLEGAVRMDMLIRLAPPKSASKAKLALMLSGDIRPVKRVDIDNVVKSVADALNKVAFDDDAQISSLHVERIYALSEGLDVTIRPAERPAWMATVSTE